MESTSDIASFGGDTNGEVESLEKVNEQPMKTDEDDSGNQLNQSEAANEQPIRQQVSQDNVNKPTEREIASTKIQRAWRRHIDIQVYKYYRDLINFRSQGDPLLMLKCVNPKEAKLIDAAAGNFVRFRLAGDRFPPNIYYKIFTNRPIQDLCANAPRDYTHASLKKLPARETNTRTVGAEKTVDIEPNKTCWYQRYENNGWRLVTDRVIMTVTGDSVSYKTANKTQEFSHSRIIRKTDVERKRKRKKIAWLRKMCFDGLLEAKSGNEAHRELIQETTEGLIAATDKLGTDVVENWEVDELLKWTNGLNYDDYLADWGQVGTTNTSDNVVAERHAFIRSKDPFEFTIKHSSVR